MRKFALYLNGRYTTQNIDFYHKQGRGRFRIAVDGGLRFFQKIDQKPDLLIGDMDSIGNLKPHQSLARDVMVFPVDKDKTDTELALDFCLERGAQDICLIMPDVGEVDHFMGLVDLISHKAELFQQDNIALRVVNQQFEIIPLSDGRRTFSDCRGDGLSVLAISPVVKLSCKGTDYDVESAHIERGGCRGLRNRIRTTRATVVVEGRALIVHRFGR